MPLSDETAIFDSLESNVRWYCRSFPAIFARAKDAEIIDSTGKRYIDFFCAAGSLNYGHNPDAIKKELVAYLLDDGIIHALDSFTVAKKAFLEQFERTVLRPRKLDYKVQFCGPTGTNAVEAALKLARKVTHRVGMFAFSGGYHGMSLGSMSVTSSRSVRASAGVPLANTTFIPFPSGLRGAFDSIDFMERMLEDPSSGVDPPAAVILETVQMDGGVYVADVEFLRALRAFCDRHGSLMICDDIQVGCGRSGDFFSFERAAIEPDVVTLSKSIGGYGLPMSILLMKRSLDAWKPGEHTGTFRGHQLAFVAATAALRFWNSSTFLSRVQTNAASLKEFVHKTLAPMLPGADLRGLGLVFGIDLAQAGGFDRAQRVQQHAFEHGLIVELCGRGDTVIKLLPPINIASEHLARGCQILAEALHASAAASNG